MLNLGIYGFHFDLVSLFLKKGHIVYPWLSRNWLCRPRLPQIQRSVCSFFCLPSIIIEKAKACATFPGSYVFIMNFCFTNLDEESLREVEIFFC